MSIHDTRRIVKKKDEHLDASKKVIEEQEDEILVSVLLWRKGKVFEARNVLSVKVSCEGQHVREISPAFLDTRLRSNIREYRTFINRMTSSLHQWGGTSFL